MASKCKKKSDVYLKLSLIFLKILSTWIHRYGVGIYPYKVISCGRVRITMPLDHQKFNMEQLIVVQLFFISLNPYIKTDNSIFMFKKFIFVVWCRQK